MPNDISFSSADGQAQLAGVWHPPTSRATNAAAIILHGRSYTKDMPPSIGLAEGAAALGLTALRFDFRYVQTGRLDAFEPARDGLDDLIGAYQFLQSFGKEIKPKRLYLFGKSLGGMVALRMASQPDYAGKIRGVGVLGLVLHGENDPTPLLTANLSGLKANLLVVQGENDPYGNPSEVAAVLGRLATPTDLKIILAAGHSYQPTNPTPSKSISQDQNVEKVVKLSLEWLERQDADRENLRK